MRVVRRSEHWNSQRSYGVRIANMLRWQTRKTAKTDILANSIEEASGLAVAIAHGQKGEPMRLIDADELITAFPVGETVRTESVRATIYHAPTIEVRKRGRWIDDNCSECGQYVYKGDARNFCPNCGAEMCKL